MKTETKHTPGLWHYSNRSTSTESLREAWVYDSCGNLLAVVYQPFWRFGSITERAVENEYLANANLIIAAPDLLAACRAVYNDPHTTCACAEKVKAAIAKAEGKE